MPAGAEEIPITLAMKLKEDYLKKFQYQIGFSLAGPSSSILGLSSPPNRIVGSEKVFRFDSATGYLCGYAESFKEQRAGR